MTEMKDMLGRPATAMEAELLDVHARLLHLAQRTDLPPCVASGSEAALALTWQMANDLGFAVDGSAR